MPRNVEVRDRVGGSFSHTDSLLYPKTHINMVEGLLTNGKFTLSLIPDGLKTGMKYAATQGADTTTAALLTIVIDNATNLGLDTASRAGSFVVTSTGYTLTVSADSIVRGDDGVSEVAAGGTIVLETNDWVVYRGNFTSVHTWDVINNTHGLATTSVAGLMSSGDKSKLDGVATGATNNTGTVTSVAASAGTGITVTGSPITTTGTLTITNTAPNATHTGDVTGAAALTIANDAVTNVKAANMAVNTVKGRITAGTGDPEDLSAAQVRTIINVQDGALNNPHHSQTAISITAGTDETINGVTINTEGHTTGFTKQTIRTGSTTQTGILQLATGTELTTALSTTKSVTPTSTKGILDYFLGMKRYADLTTANAASHPDGTIVLVTVT